VATHGTSTIAVTAYDALQFTWNRVSVSIYDNTSTIEWKLRLAANRYGAIESTAPKKWSATINGVSYSGTNTVGVGANEIKTLASGTTTIKHNTDGTKLFSFSFSQEFAITFAGNSIGMIVGNGSAYLDTINRPAQIKTATDFTDEGAPSFTYTNYVGDSAEMLIANVSWDGIAYIHNRDIPKDGTSFTFELTENERETLREAMANIQSMGVLYTLVTVIGGQSFTSTIEKTARIVNGNPIIECGVVDTNATTTALTGNSKSLVKYASNAKVTMTATPRKGASVASSWIKNGSEIVYNKTEHTFNAVENNSFLIGVTDSRGAHTRAELTPTIIPYVRLTCNVDNVVANANGAISFDVSGDYFNGNFGAAANTLSVQYRYKEEDGAFGAWQNVSVTPSNNNYVVMVTLSGLNYQKGYTIQARAIDKIATIESGEVVTKSKPVFSWSKEDFQFDVPVRMMSDLRLKGDGNYGNTIRFGDGDYCYITEATDDALTIKATNINLAGNVNFTGNVKFNGTALPAIASGTWTPSMSYADAVTSYEVRQGWWQKVGNVVTIGWQIKATCKSGYTSTYIEITGVPFTPSVSAMGGGLAYNVYIQGGYCFEAWTLETTGEITPRLQPCNETAAKNLNIARGVYYPTGGGQITLAGTLCFTTDD
jgi:hypothetical protein